MLFNSNQYKSGLNKVLAIARLGWYCRRHAHSTNLVPSTSKPMFDNFRAAPKSSAPLSQSERFTIMCHTPVSPGVIELFRICGPFAVRWFVIPIHINTLYGHSTGANPHVTKKSIETITPSSANGDTTTPVIHIPMCFPIATALKHIVPASVCAGPTHSVLFKQTRRSLSLKTTAGFCLSSTKGVGAHRLTDSALANTNPMCRTPCVLTCDGEAPEFVAGKIIEFIHFVTSKFSTVVEARQAAVKQLFGSYPSRANESLAWAE